MNYKHSQMSLQVIFKVSEINIEYDSDIQRVITLEIWSAPTKDTTSYVRVKDSSTSGAGGR